jgi:hypothetical protein
MMKTMLRPKSRTWLAPALATLIGLVLLATPPARAEVVYPPGLRIGLEPPAGMRINPANSRFEDPDRQATITILDLPLHLYPEMERMVFAEASQSGGAVLKRESFPFASGIGYYAAVRLTVNGIVYRKWILLASSVAAPISDLAALISFQIPEETASAYPEDVVRAALSSVTFRPTPIEERLGLMPFVISDFGGFKVTQVFPNGVVLNDPAEPGGMPRIFVSVGQGGPDNPDERARFARDLVQTVPLADLDILSGEPMRIRGMPGYEIKARAKDATGAEMALVQWIRFNTSGYLMMLAGTGKNDWDRFYPRFRALRDGIDPR